MTVLLGIARMHMDEPHFIQSRIGRRSVPSDVGNALEGFQRAGKIAARQQLIAAGERFAQIPLASEIVD
jgi:hypothetical protein